MVERLTDLLNPSSNYVLLACPAPYHIPNYVHVVLVAAGFEMLSRVVKEHQDKQALFREQQEQRRKAAFAAVQKCTNTMVDSLNSGVEKAYENQKKLDHEAKALQAHSSRYVKQTTQWLNLVEGFHKNMKSLGDLEQWAKTIEADMQTVVATLEYAYRGSGEVHVLHEAQTLDSR